MKYALAVLSSNLVSLALVVAAGVLAFKGLPGWGWMLFGAIITATTIEARNVK